MKIIEGNIVDIYRRKIFPGSVLIDGNKIFSIEENKNRYDNYILPGFIDAHVHIESSMLTPVEFSKLAISKGTVAIINDPHEIANVLGTSGINYMIENSRRALIKIFFTIPSCVPATPFDVSGDVISLSDTEELLKGGDFIGLSEVMNVPGVLQKEQELLKKIELFRRANLVIDGHAPGLTQHDLNKYISVGITTDHECSNSEEALEKIHAGMKILIREGSAARNYEALKSLIGHYSDHLMFCTDDSHPDDLFSLGHIDKLVKRAIKDGFDLFDILKIAILNPIRHYGVNVGTLRQGDSADFIICKDLISFETLSVYIEGEERYNKIHKHRFSTDTLNTMSMTKILECSKEKFKRSQIKITEVAKKVKKNITAIQVQNNEILTTKRYYLLPVQAENLEADISQDLLKIVYLNRYVSNSVPQIAYISGIGLKRGAFATSVSHDSHNIIAIGTNDKDLTDAINKVLSNQGGLSVVDDGEILSLSLPIAGIMTDRSGEYVAGEWEKLVKRLQSMGCGLESPFMTLSFMALVVIPELKIGEKGLFDYSKFDFISNE